MYLDNNKTVDLPILLNEDTTLKRFYPLISKKQEIVNKLIDAGIVDAEHANFDSLRAKTDLSETDTALVSRFFKLYPFTPRKLTEANSVSRNFIGALISVGKNTSLDYISLCETSTVSEISNHFSATEADVRRLYSLCDLMRLPGVKFIRADLYFDCGYTCLQDFANSEAHQMRDKITACIEKLSINKSVPQMKELLTQIAYAKVLPRLKNLA